MSATLPPEAPATEPLERAPHPAIAALADLHARRIAGDEPTADEWRTARLALASDRDRALALELNRYVRARLVRPAGGGAS